MRGQASDAEPFEGSGSDWEEVNLEVILCDDESGSDDLAVNPSEEEFSKDVRGHEHKSQIIVQEGNIMDMRQ